MAKEKMIIMKVWKNKSKNQKLVTVPKDCDIKEGDYIYMKKVKKEERRIWKKKNIKE
jgi:hypothetical protein